MIKKDQDESMLSFKAYFLLSTENVYRTGGVFDRFEWEKQWLLTPLLVFNVHIKSFESNIAAVEMHQHGSGFFYLLDATVAFTSLLFIKDFGK